MQANHNHRKQTNKIQINQQIDSHQIIRNSKQFKKFNWQVLLNSLLNVDYQKINKN